MGAEGSVRLTDFWCLGCITGWMVVPFTEIRNLEKDQVWEEGLRVWFVLADKFVTVIDERNPCLLSLS